jgi:ATP-binding cassette subfamily C protein
MPVLDVAIHSGESAVRPEGFQARVLEALERLGVPLDLEPLLLILMAFFAAKALLLVAAKFQVGVVVTRVATNLRLRLLRAFLGTRWSYYTRLPAGAASNTLSTEADRAALTFYNYGLVCQHGVEAMVAVCVSLAISWHATVAAAVAAALSLWLLRVFLRMSSRGGRSQTKLLRSLSARLVDVLQAAKLLRATAREPLVGRLLENETRRLHRALLKQVLGKEALNVLQEPLLVGFSLLALWAGLRLLAIPSSELVVLLLLFARTLGDVGKLQRKLQTAVTQESALWSILSTIEEAEAAREPAGGEKPPRLERAIVLRDVRVVYDGQEVLHDAHVEVPAGSITALVGPSGSGKTTIVDLITGLVRPDAGRVEVDGVALSEIDLRRWRETIGYVPQEPFLLNSTVRTNVTLGDEAVDDAAVERALRDAEVWETVRKLPGGLDAPVGERGALLSGGQRQRIAIARALAHGPLLLILDEPTAALDPDTETAVWRTVARLRGRVTVVAVSHQPALARVADRVYRVEAGKARLALAPEGASARGVA